MSKIILRDKETAKTREVSLEKWNSLTPEAQKDLLESFDKFDVPEPAMREAEVIAGLRDEGPGMLESAGRGAAFGLLGREPTTIGGAVAEAAGSGLRDAILAGVAAKRGMPALAKAIPTLTGAAEGALDPNLPVPGIAERATGAVVGGLLANIPTPKILERATTKLGTAVGEAIGRRQVKAAEKGEKVAAAAMESAEEAMKTAQEAAKGASEEAAFFLQQEAKNPGVIDRLKETLERGMTPEELAKDAEYEFIVEAKKQLDATKKAEEVLKKSKEAFGKSEKILKTSKETLEKTQKGVEPMTTAGTIAAGVGTQSAMADLIRQAPQQAIAAVAADPRLQGRELSSITPAEMYEALKRAIQLAMDPEERARNIAITDAQLKAAKEE